MKVTVDGLDTVLKVLKNFDNSFEFEDNMSEDFKNGFNYFKTVFIKVLEELKDGDE